MKALLGIGGFVISSSTFASCGSAFCSVNSNWTAESAVLEQGASFDLRYETIQQDQPRHGSDKVAVGQLPAHHDEVHTTNRNLLASFGYTFNAHWGLSIVAPFLDREHVHIHHHHGAALDERWNFHEPGDVRVLGRYQFADVGNPLQPAATGLTFGFKLPTGRTNLRNADGDLAERSLQPGTGTTDAVIGVYHHQKLPSSQAAWFVQAQFQHALNQKDDYRPGNQFGADLGYRHGITDKLGGLLQLNYVAKRRDSGTEAEPEDSGSRSWFLSPGLAYALTDKLQVYGFVQQPLHQHVNGVQLTAERAFVIGVTGRF